MKKFVSLFVAVSLIFSLLGIVSFAEDAVPEIPGMMGDADGDKTISASDARAVLRYSARIEPSDNVDMLVVDADQDGSITASDARTVLRVSAKLEKFTTGFNADGAPNAVDIIKSGKYTIEAEFADSESAGDVYAFTVIKDGNNSCIKISDEYIGDMSDGDFSVGGMGVMILDGKTYAIAEMNGVKVAITEEFIKEAFEGEDENMLNELNSLIGTEDGFFGFKIPDKLNAPVKITENGEDYFIYNFSYDDLDIAFKTDVRGNIVGLSSSDGTLIFKIKSVSPEADGEIFNIDSYTLL